MLKRLTRVAVVITANIGVLLILLLLAEGGYRVYRAWALPEMDYRMPMCAPHPKRIWHYRAGFAGRSMGREFDVSVRTNRLRLRGPEPRLDAPTRILVIGDSFTFGWGVEERERYSERLAAALGPDIEVINAGHWSYTFDQQYLLLQDLLPIVRPHVVVQGFYWPHVNTLSARSWRTDHDGRLLATTQPGIRVDERGELKFRSDWIERPPFGSLLIAFTARHLLNRELARQTLVSEQGLITPGYREADELWSMTATMVQQTRDLLRAHAVAWLPFTIPVDIEVSEQEWHENTARRLIGKDLGLPARRLAGIFVNADVPLIDLLPVFRAGYRPDLYFVRDPHWTAAGHQLAAVTLLPAVRDRVGR